MHGLVGKALLSSSLSSSSSSVLARCARSFSSFFSLFFFKFVVNKYQKFAERFSRACRARNLQFNWIARMSCRAGAMVGSPALLRRRVAVPPPVGRAFSAAILPAPLPPPFLAAPCTRNAIGNQQQCRLFGFALRPATGRVHDRRGRHRQRQRYRHRRQHDVGAQGRAYGLVGLVGIQIPSALSNRLPLSVMLFPSRIFIPPHHVHPRAQRPSQRV